MPAVTGVTLFGGWVTFDFRRGFYINANAATEVYMSQVNTQIDPRSTNRVLTHLGLAIEEIKLLRAIDRLNEQIRLSESEQLDTLCRGHLVAELRFLNKQLSTLRDKASARQGARPGYRRSPDTGI